MKNRKWLTYTVGVLLTLVVLAIVGGAGFRIGMMQNASFARPAFAHNFEGVPQAMQDNFKDNGGPQALQGNSRNQRFDNRGDDRRDGFSPIFGLFHLVVLGLLLWVGYKLVKNSGWRLTRVQAASAPEVNTTPSMEVEQKKESE
jgi:hypothetical protein